MARWVWATDNRDALNLDLVTRLEVEDNGNGTFDVIAYYTTGTGELGRTVARDETSLSAAQGVVETIIGQSAIVYSPVGNVIDVDL